MNLPHYIVLDCRNHRRVHLRANYSGEGEGVVELAWRVHELGNWCTEPGRQLAPIPPRPEVWMFYEFIVPVGAVGCRLTLSERGATGGRIKARWWLE